MPQPEPRSPDEPRSKLASEVAAARRELRSIEASLDGLNTRLTALERAINAPPAAAKATHPQPAPVAQLVRAATSKEPRPPSEWEQIVGKNWLVRIGVVALIFGVAFLLKYASDNHWLGPLAWVILGAAAGLVFLLAGYRWRERYPVFSQALSGGGIAVLYITFFAAHAGFHIIPFYPSLAILFLISLSSTALALKYSSVALAAIGTFGAYSAPFFLSFSSGPGGAAASAPAQLPLYVIVVNLGVLALSASRGWRWFTLVALAGSVLTFGGWYALSGDTVSVLYAELMLTAIFLLFFAALVFFHVVRRLVAASYDYFFLIVGAVCYFGLSLFVLRSVDEWSGLFSALLSCGYFGLAAAFRRANPDNRAFGNTALGIAIGLTILAAPIQFQAQVWTVVVWAVEFVALTWLSGRSSQLGYYGIAIFALMLWRLVIHDINIDVESYRPILNERALAFVSVILAAGAASLLLWRRRALWEWRNFAISLLVAANILTVAWLSLELWTYFGIRLAELSQAELSGEQGLALKSAQALSLTALWALYAVVWLTAGIRRRSQSTRLWALGLLGLATLKLFIFDVWALALVYRIVAFVGLGLLLVASGFLYQRHSRAVRGFFTGEKAP